MTLPPFLRPDERGEILLAGHRVGLHHLVERYCDGASPEALAAAYPTVPLATIHKVIAFYLEDQIAVDKYVASIRTEIDSQSKLPTRAPTEAMLRERMSRMRLAKTA